LQNRALDDALPVNRASYGNQADAGPSAADNEFGLQSQQLCTKGLLA